MNIWHDIKKERIAPDNFTAVIEISKGGKNKYELDKETGMLRLDRVLYTSTHYPANYGFIPKTYAEDNDPLDVLVLCSEQIMPMTLVECRPIGILYMIDEEDKDDGPVPAEFLPGERGFLDLAGLFERLLQVAYVAYVQE